MKILKWSLFLFALALLSCHKDEFVTTEDIDPPDPKINLYKTIYGQITNQKGDPVPNAQLSFKNKTYSSDQSGYFSFQDYVSTERSILKIQHPVFYTSHIQLKAFDKGNIPVSIHLNYLNNKQSFSSESAFQLQDFSGTQLDIEANAIANKDNTLYKGNVSIGMKYLNPIDHPDEMNVPTDLIGINDNNQITGLQSFGIIQLSLKDNLNQDLFLKNNSKVKIAIVPGMLPFAETQLYFWNLDVLKGTWIKKDLATRNGNFYEGTIKGSEFWMVAKEIPVSKISGKIKSIEPLPLLNIRFDEPTKINNRRTYCNDAGNYEIYLPHSTNYIFNTSNSFHELLSSNPLSAIYSPISLPEIDLQNNNCFPVQYKITSCTGMDPISNWLIVREIGNINDVILYPGINNSINQIIKVHEKGSYILFPSIGSEQYFNYGEPQLLNSHTSNLFKTLEVCDNPGGQSLLLLDKNDPANTLSHFLPYNNLVFDQSSPNNGVIHLYWTDFYDQNTFIDYALDCKMVNGSLEFLSREIKMKITGRPFEIIYLELTDQSKITLNRNPLKDNYYKIDISNLLAITGNNDEYHASLNGHYFTH